MTKTVTAYKAFNADWTCRGFQYEVGKTYEMEGAVETCKSGFHACTFPADIWSYYDITQSKIARVSVVDPVSHDEDSKVASAKITIEAEVSIPEWIGATVKAIFGLCGKAKKRAGEVSEAASGDYSTLAASGCSSKLAASGDSSKLAASGCCSTLAASGDSSTLAASGDSSKLAASGNYSTLAASGCSSKLAASGHSSKLAASGNSSKLAASGNYSKLAASGHSSKLAASGCSSKLAASGDSSKLAASGNYSTLAASGHSSKLAASGCCSTLAASGNYSTLAASGNYSRAKAGPNGAIALAYHDGKRPRFAVGYVGEDGIKADTWYEVRDGKLAEVQQ